MYFRMCAKALVRYRRLAQDLETVNRLDPIYDLLFEQVEEASVEPVIFAGMSLEAALFDLGACLFGEDFAAHTDKLDPVGKYVVLAQIVDRQAPNPSGFTLQSIQALVTSRNKLVHHKSQNMLDSNLGNILDRAKKDHAKHLVGISSSFSALVLLSLHFDGNIFEELRILPSFKKPEFWEKVVPAELHGDVKRCIELSAKEAKNTALSIPHPFQLSIEQASESGRLSTPHSKP